MLDETTYHKIKAHTYNFFEENPDSPGAKNLVKLLDAFEKYKEALHFYADGLTDEGVRAKSVLGKGPRR